MHFTTLLIEPPGIDSQLIDLMLAPEKFLVTKAECGPAAWNLIIESEPPDLVIIDTDLPLKGNVHIGASRLMELMSSRPDWSKIPKLVLTSHSSSSIFQQTTKKNVCAAILKPYDPRRFIQEVFNCIRKRLDAHIKEINRQHIQLGTEIKNVCNMTNQEDIKESLGMIHSHIESHHAFEEQFMSQHCYPDFIDHQKGHKQMLKDTEILIDEIYSSNPNGAIEKMKQLNVVVFDEDQDKKYISFLYDLLDSLTSDLKSLKS
ncbi:MAG: response regulator [Candidatus Thiodiazotropha sp.]